MTPMKAARKAVGWSWSKSRNGEGSGSREDRRDDAFLDQPDVAGLEERTISQLVHMVKFLAAPSGEHKLEDEGDGMLSPGSTPGSQRLVIDLDSDRN